MEVLNVNNSKTAGQISHSPDLNLEEKIKKAEAFIEKENRARLELIKKIEERKLRKSRLNHHLSWEYDIYAVDQRRKVIQYLQQLLEEHQIVDLEHYEHTIKVNRLFHQLQHGRNTWVKEKKIFGAIKLCGDEREEKLLIDAPNTKSKQQYGFPWYFKQFIKSKHSTEEILKSDELIKEQIKLLLYEQEGLEKQKFEYYSKVRRFYKKLEDADKDIFSLERKLEDVNRRKGELYACILQLKM